VDPKSLLKRQSLEKEKYFPKVITNYLFKILESGMRGLYGAKYTM